MSTTELKYSIFELIASINDESRLETIYQSLKSNDSDWWEGLSNDQKSSIEKGLDDIENGRLTSHKNAITELDTHIKNYG